MTIRTPTELGATIAWLGLSHEQVGTALGVPPSVIRGSINTKAFTIPADIAGYVEALCNVRNAMVMSWLQAPPDKHVVITYSSDETLISHGGGWDARAPWASFHRAVCFDILTKLRSAGEPAIMVAFHPGRFEASSFAKSGDRLGWALTWAKQYHIGEPA